MKKLLIIAALVLAPFAAKADSITIQLSGSALTGLTTNPSVSYTLSDADLQNVINWATVAFAGCLTSNYGAAPYSNGEVLACWIQDLLYVGTKNAVQQFMVTPPVVPAPIGIAPGANAPTH